MPNLVAFEFSGELAAHLLAAGRLSRPPSPPGAGPVAEISDVLTQRGRICPLGGAIDVAHMHMHMHMAMAAMHMPDLDAYVQCHA